MRQLSLFPSISVFLISAFVFPMTVCFSIFFMFYTTLLSISISVISAARILFIQIFFLHDQYEQMDKTEN